MKTARSILTSLAAFVIAGSLQISPVLAAEPLAITKECNTFTGDVPSFCTITDSTLAAIPAGSKVYYYGPLISDLNYTSSKVMIDAGPGNRAHGYCSLLGYVGTCSFYAGSGTLAGFHAAVQVAFVAGGPGSFPFTWNGTYRLDPRH
jgi:hypothetical protein